MKKKLLSALLAAGMLFTMAPAVAMAEPAQQTSESQIVYSGGSAVVESSDQNKVSFKKTISPTETENVFDITLQVTTSEELQNISTSPDAAVVLVIDTSGSMDGKKMNNAKNAARSFVEGFSSKVEKDTKRYVSVVQFASDATLVKEWTDITTANGKRAIINKINMLYAKGGILNANGGTNMEGGLQLAYNLIKHGKKNVLEGIDNINVVFLTDGEPTFHIGKKTNRNSISKIPGTMGGGDCARYVDWKPVETIASSITTEGYKLYTIALDLNGVKLFEKENGWWEPRNVSDWLGTFSTAKYNASANELINVFKNIQNQIALGAKAWLVTDPMGQYIGLTGDLAEIGSHTVMANAEGVTTYTNQVKTEETNGRKQLVWDVKNSGISSSSINADGTKTYSYQLTYRITLDTTGGAIPETGVSTNGDTTLTYMLTEDGKDIALKTVTIPQTAKDKEDTVPYVTGQYGSLSFIKVDPNGNRLSGAVFKLEGTATGSRKPVTFTTTSGEDGTVSFDKIPAGTYTLTETTPPKGYNACDPYNVTVSYGQTTVTRNGAEVDLSQNVVDDYEDDPITISGKKSWEDNDNQDNKRPQSVTIRLIKNGVDTDETTTASADSNWEYSFSGLAPYDGNTKNNYTIQEETVEDYSTLIDNINYNVTNSYTPETTSYTVTKSWDDNNNQDGKRPGSVTVQLCKTVTEDDLTKEVPIEGKTLTLSADNGWTGTFDNLAVYEDGQPITYTVQETVVPDGYESTVSRNPETHTFTVTNTHTPETVDISGSKTWDDGDNQDNIRPDSITIRLLADEAPYAFQSVTEENQWTWSFENLPKYKNGDEIIYTITEDPVEGYVAKVDDNSYNVTNTHIPATVDINVAKSWNDDGDRDGKRPDSVEIQLYRTLTKDDSAEEYDVAVDGKTLTLDESNGWKDTFTDLPANEKGVPIQYTVKESNVSEDYVSSVDKIEDGSFVITNSYTPESITVCGSKTWDDQNNKDGVRPACIVIRLYADGEQVAVQNVTEKEQWSWNFGSLPKYRDGGVEIKYTITEDAVEGYTATVNGYDVTNTHTIKPTATPAPTAAPTARPDDPAPTATPTPAPAVAQTSDNSHPMLWVALLVVAAIGMTGVVVLKKRQNNK